MIYNLEGRIVRSNQNKVYLEAGHITYEVLMPESVLARLNDYIKDEKVGLIIYHYLQADQHRLYPVLIGFLNELEKEFYEKILTVSGVGPKAALKVLNRPISEIARAIDKADLDYLKALPGVGMQRAKNIIAFLQGKVGKFTLIKDAGVPLKETQARDIEKQVRKETEQIMLKLQYKKSQARDMIEKAFKANPEISSVEELLTQIYMQRK